jgi:Nucleotidyl transferase AbiEii toxin, Type IV TA system
MNNHHTNLEGLQIVASALSKLNEKVVFVGGATVGLYADDTAAAEPRPTDDIDVVVEVTTYGEFSSQIEERLRQLGFTNDQESGVICRYKIHGLTVDVMPTDPDVLGFSNKWYKDGIAQSVPYQLNERQVIRIFSAPYFIATKLEAFKSYRHGRDPRMNSDFEDLIYLFDNRNELLSEIKSSAESLRSYLKHEIATLLNDPNVDENVYVHLERTTAPQRTQRILKIWDSIRTI